MIYDYNILFLDTLLNNAKPFNKYKQSCVMARLTQKNI